MRKNILSILVFLIICLPVFSQNMSGVKIYINPGHGGYDSDDRNVVIPPFTSGDKNGFWESKSNLHKGLMLKQMLDSLGATTYISRTTNTTADDLPLSQIVRSANEANVDFMLSIHSNAGTTANSAVLMIYAGISPGDTHTYPTPTPCSEESRLISTEIAKNLYSNQLTAWSSGYSVQGDKTFARIAMGWSNGYGVLRGLTVPGVISEGSHHDYTPETYRLMNMEYKWLEAWHFMKSFLTYFKSEKTKLGVIAGNVKDKFLKNEADYNKIPNTHDELLPINGAKVTLLPNNITYTTDDLNNGVYLFKNLEPGEYTVITSHPDYHSDTTKINVIANEVTYHNVRINRMRKTPPEIVGYSPNVNLDTTVLAASTIQFRFNWDIDPESAKKAFSISPSIDGTFKFMESNYLMEFIPSVPLDTSTVYTVTMSKELSHYDGLSMEEDFNFQFKTDSRNRLALLASYPILGGDVIHYENPTFTFVFDKKLETADLKEGIQVYDAEGNVLAKNLRSLKHNKVQEPYGSTSFMLAYDLTVGENYVVKLAKGITDVDGVFLTDTIKFPFIAKDMRVEDKKVVETFESKNLLTNDDEWSKGVLKYSSLRSSSEKLFDVYSYKLKYEFTDSNGGEAVYKFSDPKLEVTNDSVIGLHIFGDMSGNEIHLIFESESDTRMVKLDSIHYGGWSFVEKALRNLLEGEKYKLTGFKLVQTNSPLSSKGSLYIDNLLIYSEMISGVSSLNVKEISLFPNPASEYFKIRLKENVKMNSIEILQLNGMRLGIYYESTVDVSGLSDGTYIVKINCDEGIKSIPIIIKH